MNEDTNFGETLYLSVARHVNDGTYSPISINASAYSFVLVCRIEVGREEFGIAFNNMFSRKEDWKYTDEEWDAHFAKMVEASGVKS